MEIIHDKKNHKFYCIVEGHECVAEYVDAGDDTLDFVHTFVSPELRGRGIAQKLYEDVLKYIKENNLKVRTSCSYAEKFFGSHQEFIAKK